MRKLLIFALVFSPLFASAQDEEVVPFDEAMQTEEVTPQVSNYCGSFSDYGCWGRFIGSFCNKYGGRYTQRGTCSPSGFRDSRGEYSCRCF